MSEIIIGQPKTHNETNSEKITPQQQLEFCSKMRDHCKSKRDFAILDSIAADLGDYKKQSGCFWQVDKRGGFDVRFYITAQHMHELQMPADDADTVTRLLARTDGASILSGCAVIMGYWIRKAKDAQRAIVEAIDKSSVN